MEAGRKKGKKKKEKKSVHHGNKQLDALFLNKDRLKEQYTSRSFRKPKSNGELRECSTNDKAL